MKKTLLSISLLAATAAPAQTPVWQHDFDDSATRALWTLPETGAWQSLPGRGTVLRVDVPAQDGFRSRFNCATLALDLAPFAGRTVTLSCDIRAERISKPRDDWNGAKAMLRITSPADGTLYPGLPAFHGTRDWARHTASFDVPDDARTGTLHLGLQDSTGTIWLANPTLAPGGFPRKIVHPAPPANPPPAFDAHPGVERLRGAMVSTRYAPEDLRVLAGWGANLIRFPISRNWFKIGDNRDVAEYKTWVDTCLDDLEKTLADAATLGIKVCIDLHVAPGGLYENKNMAMFFERDYADAFVDVWRTIAARFAGHPALWAYDLINEPAQTVPSPEGADDWLALQTRAARAIREIDASTPIIVAPCHGGGPDGFDCLAPLPPDITGVVYQVHMYHPHEYTHQFVHGGDGELIPYPGTLNGRRIDKDYLRRKLAPVRRFQLAYNVPIYCGEFSAVRWAPGADAYIADCIALFEEYGWDWSYHAFREWDGWDVEFVEDRAVKQRADSGTPRMKALLDAFGKNKTQ